MHPGITLDDFIEMACNEFGCALEPLELNSEIKFRGPDQATDLSGAQLSILRRQRKGKRTRSAVLPGIERSTELTPNSVRSLCAKLDIPYSAVEDKWFEQ